MRGGNDLETVRPRALASFAEIRLSSVSGVFGKRGRLLIYPASQSSVIQLSIRRSRNLCLEHKPITAYCQEELRRGYCEEKKSIESRKGRTKTNVTMTVNMNVSPAIPKTMTEKPKVSPIAILTTPLIAPGFTQVALSSHLGKTYLD